LENVSYNSAEVVFNKGDLADNLYLLQRGAFNLFMAGTEQATCVAIKAGQAVGWSILVGRNTYRTTVQCVETSKLYKINGDKLDRILRQYPSAGLRFYKKLTGLVSERVIKCYQEKTKIREGELRQISSTSVC
jgi:CRP-like cAMP-binding protein